MRSSHRRAEARRWPRRWRRWPSQALGDRRAALLLLLLLAPSAVCAQARPDPPRPGEPARITVACPSSDESGLPPRRDDCRVVGHWVGVLNDAIALNVAGAVQRYTLASLHRLEVGRGRESHWLVGAAIGLPAGLAVTRVVLYSGASTSPCNRTANQDALAPGECAGLLAVGTLAGAGAGAAIGALVRSERWQEVPIENLRVGLGRVSPARLGWTVKLVF